MVEKEKDMSFQLLFKRTIITLTTIIFFILDQEAILPNFDFIGFSIFAIKLWPLNSTENIFLSYKHSSLTTKNGKNLRFTMKKVW
jgi:hypothetical protein